MTPDYYSRKLAADRLRRCYELAPPRVQAYLDAEIAYVRERAPADGRLLELGCGYGRVLRPLALPGRRLVGIDTSLESLQMGRRDLRGVPGIELAAMDALRLGFPNGCFALVACIQNGISAFRVDPLALVREALRVTRPGGLALFSSYAERFWNQRLAWFRIQARHGLVGEIDEAATRDGTIVCKDGFHATTFSPEKFADLCQRLGVVARIEEVASASVFCEIRKPARSRAGRPRA
jgi:SAM-dependent methyltransferase